MNKLLTPDTCGCSQLACNIINNTFLSLDGFEAMRKQMAGTTYTAEHFGAELARIVDREIADVQASHLEVIIGSLNDAIDEAKNGLVSEDLARNALASGYELKSEA